jgi:hypothetical protein
LAVLGVKRNLSGQEVLGALEFAPRTEQVTHDAILQRWAYSSKFDGLLQGLENLAKPLSRLVIVVQIAS